MKDVETKRSIENARLAALAGALLAVLASACAGADPGTDFADDSMALDDMELVMDDDAPQEGPLGSLGQALTDCNLTDCRQLRPAQLVGTTGSATGVLRVENRAQYTLLEVDIDGRPQPLGHIPPRNAATIRNLAAGSHSYALLLGPPGVGALYAFRGTITVPAGSTAQLAAPRLNVGQALTDGAASRDFSASYVDLQGFHVLTFRFFATNRYEFFQDGVKTTPLSQPITEKRWNDDSAFITFSVHPALPDITSGYPHASFISSNGPSGGALLYAR